VSSGLGLAFGRHAKEAARGARGDAGIQGPARSGAGKGLPDKGLQGPMDRANSGAR